MSQPSRGRRRRISSDDEEEDVYSFSQPTDSQGKRRKGEAALDKTERDKLVGDLIRYTLFQDHVKHPIKRDEINKNILKEHKNITNSIISDAKAKFKDIFGYDFVEVPAKATNKNNDKTSTGIYILKNRLPRIPEDTNNNNEDDSEIDFHNKSNFDALSWNKQESTEMALLMTILAMIFLNNNSIDEDSLFDQLKRLGFDERGHDVFGDWKKLIDQKFVRQLYLTRKKGDKTDASGKTLYEYRMGQRSILEITKRNVLLWISQVYGDKEVDPHALKELDMEDEQNEEEQEEEEESQNSHSQPAPRASTSGPRRGGRR